MNKAVLILVVILLNCKEHKTPDAEKRNSKPEVDEIVSVAMTSATISTDGVNVRLAAGTESKVITLLNKGTVVAIQGRSSEKSQLHKCEYYWFKIAKQGMVGWVYGESLTDFKDKSRKPTRIPNPEAKLEVQVPGSWDTTSVWTDMTGAKIAEDHSVDEYSGDFFKFIQNKEKKTRESDNDTKTHTITKLQHPTLAVIKVRSEVTYEGGCPKWVGVWYPTTYYFRMSNDKYTWLTLYLRDLEDTQSNALFDQIAQSAIIR